MTRAEELPNPGLFVNFLGPNRRRHQGHEQGAQR